MDRSPVCSNTVHLISVGSFKAASRTCWSAPLANLSADKSFMSFLFCTVGHQILLPLSLIQPLYCFIVSTGKGLQWIERKAKSLAHRRDIMTNGHHCQHSSSTCVTSCHFIKLKRTGFLFRLPSETVCSVCEYRCWKLAGLDGVRQESFRAE